MTFTSGTRVATVLAVLAAGQASCSSENGRGIIRGDLLVPACTFDKKGRAVPLYDEEKAPEMNAKNPDCRDPNTNEVMPFCGEWNHFLGEPFDSTSARYPANQIGRAHV